MMQSKPISGKNKYSLKASNTYEESSAIAIFNELINCSKQKQKNEIFVTVTQ